MISTRVMDIKLRESAEGLGEDSTGESLAPPAKSPCVVLGQGRGRIICPLRLPKGAFAEHRMASSSSKDSPVWRKPLIPRDFHSPPGGVCYGLS